MQTILNDIELDMADLKCLLQAMTNGHNPALAEVARRNIRQMQRHLDALDASLQGLASPTPPASAPSPAISPETPEAPATPAPGPTSVKEEEENKPSAILAERIRPVGDLRHALSLNDSFRFSRELFGGNTARMNQVLSRLGEAASLEEALGIFSEEIHAEDGNEAANDLLELLKKYFDR